MRMWGLEGVLVVDGGGLGGVAAVSRVLAGVDLAELAGLLTTLRGECEEGTSAATTAVAGKALKCDPATAGLIASA